jgi:putative heme iron utilization protein
VSNGDDSSDEARTLEVEPDDAEEALAAALNVQAQNERQAADDKDPERAARSWLLTTTTATLCTLSADPRIGGHPFGSIVPFALDSCGRPLVLIASIAEHTKNVKQDPRCSLFVSEPGVEGDAQRGWRVTVTGRLVKTDPSERQELFARYVERVRDAVAYEVTHGFELWRLEPLLVRSIAGFGKIRWLQPSSIVRDPLALGAAAVSAIAHMNADHEDALQDIVCGHYGFRPARAAMVSLDAAGFLVRTDAPDRLSAFSFGREIDAGDIRPAILEVLKRARAALAGLDPATPAR